MFFFTNVYMMKSLWYNSIQWPEQRNFNWRYISHFDDTITTNFEWNYVFAIWLEVYVFRRAIKLIWWKLEQYYFFSEISPHTMIPEVQIISYCKKIIKAPIRNKLQYKFAFVACIPVDLYYYMIFTECIDLTYMYISMF